MKLTCYQEGPFQPPLFHYHVTASGKVKRMKPQPPRRGRLKVVFEVGDPFPSEQQRHVLACVLVRTGWQAEYRFKLD
ncbi:MAG: hypothetical protein R3D70_06015 [Rhizobiaceae bacterium]